MNFLFYTRSCFYSVWKRPDALLQEKYNQVEQFIKTFTKEVISKGVDRVDKFNVTFARSSGPGGQNVNKVNTKVDLRFHVMTAHWLPIYIRQQLTHLHANRINRKGEITFSSDRHRTQNANLQDCVDKVYDAIVEAGRIPKGPSQDTLDRIKLHQNKDNQARMTDKRHKSRKKADRRRDVF